MPRVCEFYLRGQCRYGVKCWNLHEVEPSMRQAVADAESKYLLYCIINFFNINIQQTL